MWACHTHRTTATETLFRKVLALTSVMIRKNTIGTLRMSGMAVIRLSLKIAFIAMRPIPINLARLLVYGPSSVGLQTTRSDDAVRSGSHWRGPAGRPWRRARRLPRDAIAQLFARRRPSPLKVDGGRQRGYFLVAIDRDGREHELVEWLPEPNEALWLAREIERMLGLRDRAVFGEHR